MGKREEYDIIKSILDRNGYAYLKEIIPVNSLINAYEKEFGIDVSTFFNNIENVKIYECKNTNYRFYYPFNIYGDSDFYQKLQKFEWYYMPWKWEHETAIHLLDKTDKILEVGSGGLGFLKRMKEIGFDITGLELNEESIVKANEIGVKVLNETIQNHSVENFQKYDIVCSFQVLEHISEVHSFLKAQVDCLKPGGKLIISVPNNDSFIKLTNNVLLNKPPHHMGLWNKKSLASLTNLFNINLDNIYFEPLQEYHIDWYTNIYIDERINKYKIIRILFKQMKLIKIYSYFIRKFRMRIQGLSILAVYTKT